MSAEDLERYETEIELQLYREYRDVLKMFHYVVETERRFYLANDVKLDVKHENNRTYFDLQMRDAWVWDMYRPTRFVADVHVVTFKDVNVEELPPRSCERPAGRGRSQRRGRRGRLVRSRRLRSARPQLASAGRRARPDRTPRFDDRVLRGEDAPQRRVRFARRGGDGNQATAHSRARDAMARRRAGPGPRCCASMSPTSVPTVAGAGSSMSSRPLFESLLLAVPATGVPVAARVGRVARGTTASCPSPGRISWSQPGQR